MKDLKSISQEMRHKETSVKNNNIQHPLELSQSASPHVAEASSSKTTARVRVNPSATEHEQVVVGLDEDVLSIMGRLAADRKQLDIISIVGMGGLGKTTLATKVFNDPYVEYYFDVRGWITVSEEYAMRNLLIGILASIGKSVDEATTEGKLSEMVYRSLKGRKYLIVIDDIWSAKAWDDLRLYFPDANTGSRVLLTTRLTEVASYASPGGFAHNLQYLSQENSWELLRRNTFRGDECPESLVGTGKHIAKKCRGLPLALVVIAGILEKEEKSKDMWDKIAETVSSYIVDDPTGCLDTLALSYDHLPRHLKNCFLYLGGFPEDCEVQVWRLMRLWMAEGFIKEAPHRSLEEQAEDYLIDLVDRNLFIVVNRRSDGGIKSCRLHDLLRELCLIKAAQEKFYYKLGMPDRSSREKQNRLFTDYKLLCEIYSHGSIAPTRSVLCFPSTRALDYVSRWVPSFMRLRVLDLLSIRMSDISDIPILIHLRYLAVCLGYSEFSFPGVSLLRLQTLILKGKYSDSCYSSRNMANMTNLRHLWSERVIKLVSHKNFPVLSNLHTISKLALTGHEDQTLLQSFPNIKKLGCSVSHIILNFALLSHLESLKVERFLGTLYLLNNPVVLLPETLKKLTLIGLRMRWDWMSTIQQLPKLEVLKLLDSSFDGEVWDTGDEQFCQLKFLKLQGLNIKLWEASSFNFPQLRKLEVGTCNKLREIPVEIGNISTLEHIEIVDGTSALIMSVNKIQEEQHAIGNYDIHVKFVGRPPREVFFEGDPYYT